MYRAWIGLLSFCVIFTVVGIVDLASPPAYVTAQEAQTPLSAVDEFYNWYFAYIGMDAQGNFNNPLADRAYRESQQLTPDLIAAVDAQIESETLFSDPFLCAQDVPRDFYTTQVREEGDRAEVLVQQQFGLTLHNITAQLVRTDNGWQIDNVACGDTFTPGGVVETFYKDYILAGQYDEEAQMRHNPLLEGAYRESPWLTNELIADLDLKVAQGGLRADPLLCAQDLPEVVYGFTVSEGDASALAILRQYFAGNAAASDVQVHLTHNGEHWQIAAVSCEVQPATVIELVYGYYAQQSRLALESGIAFDMLEMPSRPWVFFLSPEMLETLKAERAASGIDPLLCAQDIPAGFEVAAQQDGSYLVSGLFPSGPEAFSSYPLAEVRGVDTLRGWDITAITCVTR